MLYKKVRTPHLAPYKSGVRGPVPTYPQDSRNTIAHPTSHLFKIYQNIE